MKARDLRRAAILFFSLLLASQNADRSGVRRFGARVSRRCAFAALEPVRKARDGAPVQRSLQGHLSFQQEDLVKADAIVCRASNVDITSRSCKLTFGAASAHLTGREAQIDRQRVPVQPSLSAGLRERA